MEIHQRIRALREARGLTQQQLADMVGYTNKSSIGKVEAGVVDLPQSKIKAFADALGTSTGYLLGLESSDLSGRIVEILSRLNQEGIEKVLDYASDLAASGRYEKESTVSAG